MSKFDLGKVVATRSVSELMQNDTDFHVFVFQCLSRHCTGDWGDVCEEDAESNTDAIDNDFRIFSVYKYNNNVKIWIIT